MITVYYEKYWHDYHKLSETKTFHTLSGVKEWMFGMMEQKYEKNMSFPTEKSVQRICADGPWGIEIRPSYTLPVITIHMMRNEYGIIFTDGRMTNRQKHWNEEVKEWCSQCEEFTRTPKFDFV